jgi:hypothetical protein
VLHPDSGAWAFFMREIIRLPCEMTSVVSQVIRQERWKFAPNPLEAVRSDALQSHGLALAKPALSSSTTPQPDREHLTDPLASYCQELEARLVWQSFEIETLRQMLRSEHNPHARKSPPQTGRPASPLSTAWRWLATAVRAHRVARSADHLSDASKK